MSSSSESSGRQTAGEEVKRRLEQKALSLELATTRAKLADAELALQDDREAAIELNLEIVAWKQLAVAEHHLTQPRLAKVVHMYVVV